MTAANRTTIKALFEDGDTLLDTSFIDLIDSYLSLLDTNSKTFTSGGTNDYVVDLAATLNDSGAAGGSDTFTALQINATLTDTTGWNNTYLQQWKVGGTALWQMKTSGVLDFLATGATDGIRLLLNGNESVVLRVGATGGRLELHDSGGANYLNIDGNNHTFTFFDNINFTFDHSNTVGGFIFTAGGTVELIEMTNDQMGFFDAAPVSQQATTGTTTGFTAGVGTAVNDDSTFTGNSGTAAYTIGDIVLALKNLGLLAAS